MTPEGQIQKEVKQYLQWTGWFVFKNHQTLGSYKGIADLTAMKKGRTLWIEIKRPKGKLSVHQEKFKADIEKCGGEYLVIRSLDEIREWV